MIVRRESRGCKAEDPLSSVSRDLMTHHKNLRILPYCKFTGGGVLRLLAKADRRSAGNLFPELPFLRNVACEAARLHTSRMWQ